MSRVERPGPAEDIQVTAERKRAARALLRRPLLHADGPGADELRLVRRHRSELERMFADGLGYRLVVEPGAARLFKTGLGRDATRPLLRRNDKAFTPRGYALLCLTIAALSRGKSQLLVDELVAQVRSAAVDAGLDIDLDAIADRRALYAALSALVDLGVLHERDGDLEHWADQATASLLDVRRDRLALLVAAPLGGVDSAADLLDVAALPSAAGGARVAVRRRLVETPVLSIDELTEEQAEWWRRGRNREREWFADRLGLDLELRAEGAVAIDPDGELTDLEFPGGGSARQLALLLVEALAAALRAGGPGERRGGAGVAAGGSRGRRGRLRRGAGGVGCRAEEGLPRGLRHGVRRGAGGTRAGGSVASRARRWLARARRSGPLHRPRVHRRARQRGAGLALRRGGAL